MRIEGKIVKRPEKLNRMARKLPSAIHRGLVRVGVMFTARVKKRYLSGQSLRRRTSLLFNSISFDVKDATRSNWRVMVGTVLYPVKYAAYQEHGFKHYRSGRLIKNPFMEPTFVDLRDKIKETMRKAVWSETL